MLNVASSRRYLAPLLGALPFLLVAVACEDNDGEPTPAAGGLGGAPSNSGGRGAAAGQGGSDLRGGSAGSDAGGDSGSAAEGGSLGEAGRGQQAGSTNDAGAGGAEVAPDVTAPTVTENYPFDEATGEASNAALYVTFSEAMDPDTLTDASFVLEQGSDTVDGTVRYFNRVATFVPATELDLDTLYTATISKAATDLAGNPLREAHRWTFTTAATAPEGPAPVLLGAASNYAVLAQSAISNVPTSVITGNLGLSPAAASYITGFSLVRAGSKWTSPQVTGGVFAANNDPPTPRDLTTAIGDMGVAYTDAATRPTPTFVNLGAGSIGGLTLAPGLYKWSSSVTIPTNVTIAGAANDVWIFQISGDLKLSSAKSMTLTGGARAKNVFWQVAGLVELGTTSHAEGIVLSKTAIHLKTGASINGRLLAQTAVTLAGATVTVPSL